MDNTIINELDPYNEESILDRLSFYDFDLFYVDNKNVYANDIIQDNLLIKNTNKEHLFYPLDCEWSEISIPDMSIDQNCHYDIKLNRFLGNNKKGIFTAIDPDTKSHIAEAKFSVGMMIKDCKFIDCNFDNSYTKTIIENNGGKIL